MSVLKSVREQILRNHIRDEHLLLTELQKKFEVSPLTRNRICTRAARLVEAIRSGDKPALMEVFLAEYGLSTDEGVALMCLAEALLRVPDSHTIDALIEDKIVPSSWGEHLGRSSSSLVNASTWALMLTGKILKDGQGVASVLKDALKRVGEPVIRTAVARAMKELGHQFVLGETIGEAVRRGQNRQDRGYTYSYDMLGEAALTANDARGYFSAYKNAITELTPFCASDDIRQNPGISIKLSALHPRYEVGQSKRVMTELVRSTLTLAKQASVAGMGLNIDAEESDRLDLSLDVIEAVLSDASLSGWDGFGVVVQAYGKRAPDVIDWLYALAKKYDRKIMVRLVKGAYWDTEIKRSQVEGLSGFPVFTQKAATDVSFICCAQSLLSKTDRIYPQFATHNAHTVAAIIEMADDIDVFEFQRLHGMGDALHDRVLIEEKTRCRIYAPVGAHRDLLAYLVRRLLENGANSSFVNQIVDSNVPPSEVASDPFAKLSDSFENLAVVHPFKLYQAERRNSKGWDLHDANDLAAIENARHSHKSRQWSVGPLIAGPLITEKLTGAKTLVVINPAQASDQVGEVVQASLDDVEVALTHATSWQASAAERAVILVKASDLFEENFGELFAILSREAGKTPLDAIAELREAVDFLRYYAARGKELSDPSRGIIACISPWNFPLAIFTGQISAALAAGNGVVAKPAEPTAIISFIAVKLMHEAGVPTEVLQLLPGPGSIVGSKITSDPRIKGICFTGSTATAQTINQAMVEQIDPTAPLIAETGGLNALIVDSTALPEQAIKDIIASAFQSAGQRCSALRLLYLQEEIAASFLYMLYGAMDELVVGDPWSYATDLGPVINEAARSDINQYIQTARSEGRLLKQVTAPTEGTFVGPAAIKVKGMFDMAKEIFGPVLHVATFKANELDSIVDDINSSGYGLTFGMHTRIDSRIEQVTSRLNVGNIYINRNQIGAIVGTQPFGGEGLSGTGPKAGGPNYVLRFTQPEMIKLDEVKANFVPIEQLQARIDAVRLIRPALLETLDLPGPTGESNRLSTYGRGIVLCLGPTKEAALQQASLAKTNGCIAICIAPGISDIDGLNGVLDRKDLGVLNGFHLIVLWSTTNDLRATRQVLAKRKSALIGLCAEKDFAVRCQIERHICIDTTAAGGNASLLAEAG
ncbi:MAG: RHH-type proline utilization regulon transcriptional repressor/proline dehydrogenase [Gammaproteobacteria bacterium]|jgi:RHH-type proline utilization regulon transcriptional repressor/proline dehydrogenase/delta 1-pyrroline-5-carboxylate dehydrogenase